MTSNHHNKVTRIPENVSSETPMLKRYRQMTSWEVDLCWLLGASVLKKGKDLQTAVRP